MATSTRACEALRAALQPGERQRMTQGELARELGVAQPSVHKWVRGFARPSDHLRKAIERLLGIPAGHWMTQAEQRIANRPRSRRARRSSPPKSARPRTAA